ncbi:MAG: bifunctional ornithine acetyltransferase/N-acetylglutamate synthase [Alkalispirochaetaceae bacterium]
MPEAATRDRYYESLEAQCKLPAGFSGATASFTFLSPERGGEEELPMNLALLAVEGGTAAYAGVTTTNRFPGYPVILTREILASGEPVGGILINNKVANVGVPGGLDDARRLSALLTGGCGGGRWFSLSTGVIGWRLPMERIEGQLEALYARRHPSAGLEIAEAIMTTDRYPKLRRKELPGGSIFGVAKGAGMIEPNMATMLSVILTDLAFTAGELDRMLRESVEKSFNRIGVDGEQSTSDVVILLSSGAAGRGEPVSFQEALDEVSGELARSVVRNGEGTAHVVKVEVAGIAGSREALFLARRVSNSPLVKSAIYGNDPNVGRILMALGDGLSDLGLDHSFEGLQVEIDGVPVFRNGLFTLTPEVEKRLAASLKESSMDPTLTGYPEHDREVTISVDFGAGGAKQTVWGSDLSYEYVRENADYRT